MGKYFSEEQIDEFLRAYTTKYPDAIDRMHFVMKHPFRDHDEENARKWRELLEVAPTLSFFSEYNESLTKGDPNRRSKFEAYYHLSHDITQRVADMLGPIGSYEIEE